MFIGPSVLWFEKVHKKIFFNKFFITPQTLHQTTHSNCTHLVLLQSLTVYHVPIMAHHYLIAPSTLQLIQTLAMAMIVQ